MVGTRMTPAPTPPSKKMPLKLGSKRTISVSSQNFAGSSRAGAAGVSQWQARGNDDIPSEDSDPGEKSPFGRPRIRKRRATKAGSSMSVTGGVSWMSQGQGRVNNNPVIPFPPGSSSSSIVGKQSAPSKRSLFPAASSQSSNCGNQKNTASSKPPGNMVSNVNNDFQRRQMRQNSVEAPVGEKRKQGLSSPKALMTTSTAAANQTTAGKMTVPRVPRVPSSKREHDENFCFYTVWFPAWDIIWKCGNGTVKSLRRNKDFRRLITEVLHSNIGPDLDVNATYDLKVLKVQSTRGCEDSYEIKGMLEDEHPINRGAIKWKPKPLVLGKLLKTVVSRGDIIVQCVSKMISSGSRRKICVHLTPQDGNKVDFCERLGGIDVQLSMYNLKYDHYVPKVVKCLISNPTLLLSSNGDQQSVPMVETSSTSATVGDAPLPSSTALVPFIPTAGAIVQSRSTEGEDVRDNGTSAAPAQPLLDNEVNQIEDVGRIDDDNVSDSSDASSKRTENNFDVENFVKRGVFVPGPLRPKARRTTGNDYQYKSLEELYVVLRRTIIDEEDRGVISNWMLKNDVHVYGIVDELVPQSRHKNARYVRISDESRGEVLVRLHMATFEKKDGPDIDVGHIIRVHRCTVQDEWDTDLGENTMVLSSFAYRNYVLFEPSNEENQFYFNSSANSITLTNCDIRRVAQLYQFKCNRTQKSNDEVPSTVHHNIVNPRDSNRQLVAYAPAPVLESDVLQRIPGASVGPRSSCDSSGICSSDLSSPALTLDSEAVTTVNSAESQCPADGSDNQLANSQSADDSFVTATSEVMDLDSVNSVPPPDQSEDNHGMEIESGLQPASGEDGFTLFKDLVKTNGSLTLLCQVMKLRASSRQNVWDLVLRDIQQTTPTDDFKNNELAAVDPLTYNNCLVINVTNASAFENRKYFSMLYDGQGTDEVYSINNIKVKGTRPPYKLEVNGAVCEIKRSPYSMMMRDCLQDSWSARSHSEARQNSNSTIQRNMMDTTGRSEAANGMQIDSDEEPQVNSACNAVPNNDVGSGSSTNVSSDFQESVEESSSQIANGPSTRSKKKETSKAPAASTTTTTVTEQWTGRLTRKRKPREFYQAEDSLSC